MHIEQLEEQARSLLRVMGPRTSAAQDEHVNVRHCLRCTPPAEVYQCVLCGFATEERWRYAMHNLINPETCQRVVTKKAKRWASRV